MSIKRIMLLASMALATTAFAMPTSALAAEEVVTETNTHTRANVASLEVTGLVKFELLGAGIECISHGAISISNGIPTAKTFSLTTSTCHGYGVGWKNCIVEKDEVKNIEQVLDGVTTTTEDKSTHTGFKTTKGEIINTLSATPGTTCPFAPDVTVTTNNVHFYPTNEAKTATERIVTTLEVQGTVLIEGSKIPESPQLAAARGCLSLENPDDKDTYEFALV